MGMAWPQDLADGGILGAAAPPRSSWDSLPDQAEQAGRLAEFRAANPDVTIGQTGKYAQAVFPLDGDGEQTVTRRTWKELLDKLEEFRPAPG